MTNHKPGDSVTVNLPWYKAPYKPEYGDIDKPTEEQRQQALRDGQIKTAVFADAG